MFVMAEELQPYNWNCLPKCGFPVCSMLNATVTCSTILLTYGVNVRHTYERDTVCRLETVV